MMIMTDPIADMLTRIRNGVQARHEVVEVPANKEKIEIAKILKEEGFITDYNVEGDVKKTINVTLKYGPNNEKVINGIRRVSKPGLRAYAKVDEVQMCIRDRYKDSREQFEIRTHKRLIEIVGPTAETIDSLSRLELPSGVDIEIKL